MDLAKQLRGMSQSLDPETGAVLYRNPNLTGVPDLVVEGKGYTFEFIGTELLCLDIYDPSALVDVLADPVKEKIPAGA
jgi:hypothetical protein